MPGMGGYQASRLQDGGRTQYMEREHDREVLKTSFFSITLLTRVAPILKVVRNLFQTFHLVDLDGLIWFMQISNDCMCVI